MEEETVYATVRFKDSNRPPNVSLQSWDEIDQDKAPSMENCKSDGKAAAAHSDSCVLALCVVLSCVLLASICGIITISVLMNEQKRISRELSADNQQLINDSIILGREREKLRNDTERLKSTLGSFLKFETFPVHEYCPEKKCRPCRKGWIMFQEKCYLVFEENVWKTWTDSRKYCEDIDSDLVIIDSLQEQEFINNHTEFYYDLYHGYWLGLREMKEGSWFWIDGRKDTLGYWSMKRPGNDHSYGLMIPLRISTACWVHAKNTMRNKFICEREVLSVI